MKIIALALLSLSSLLLAQAKPQATKNEFPIVIEGVNCVVKAYKPVEPIIYDPIVNKDALPKSQMIKSIMLTNSDITSHLSDEDLAKYMKSVLVDENEKQAERDKIRNGMKKMYAETAADAEDNPRRGMKFGITQVFIVESDLGKYLVYQIAVSGGKDMSGRLTGSRIFSDGLWLMGGDKDAKTKDFKLSMLENIPKEFDRLQKESAVVALPLEDLLK